MLGILLHILKIIGMILLVILAVILAFILIALFVPVRYRILAASAPVDPSFENPSFAQAAMRNETKLQVKISWLLHIFSIHFQMKMEGQTDPEKKPVFEWEKIREKMFCKIRIFGIRILDVFHMKPRPEKKRRRPAGKKQGKKKQSGQKDEEKESVTEAQGSGKGDGISGESGGNEMVTAKPDGQKEPAMDSKEQESIEDEETSVGHFFKKIAGRIKKIFEKTAHIKYTVIETFQKIGRGKQKADDYIEVLTGEQTKGAREKILKLIKMIWKGVRPKKSRVVLVLGFKDPELMGKVLAAFGMCIPIFRDTVTVTPDFERFRFELAGDIKGRITLFTFLRAGLKVLTDKEIRRFIKLFTEPDYNEVIK